MSSSYSSLLISPPPPPSPGADDDDVSSYLISSGDDDDCCLQLQQAPKVVERPAASLVPAAHHTLRADYGDAGGTSGGELLLRHKIHEPADFTGGAQAQPCGAAAAAATSASKSGSRKIAFKTRSDVDVPDDGYRWRKYGKKMVKHSPNPRNYYRCSREGCPVKKRVQRHRDDARFVVTTYDGVHNHHPAPAAAPLSRRLAS